MSDLTPADPVKITVLVVDDHLIVRQGLRGMLATAPGIEVVAEAASGDEVVAVAPRVNPDVILMDLRMPHGDGVDAIQRLGSGYRVIVLTTYSDDTDIRRAVESGAAGYLLKDVSVADLAAAIGEVAAGRRAMSPEVAARLAARQQQRPELSERERDVLALVADGLTNSEIGDRLFIGEATVKTYLVRVFGKLGVADRTAAVVAAIDRGLLT